ncbi:hypothetical protein L1987_33126 [Smallanthus sonchifolius]|uniref:Uncharacterized protein n=1 Tax=Smallanthus sonchifolius TaxID=185202 RepID=A0ACB9HSS6_9ASTR|nr:hypothetical protein L1987_33126 [Smallanthus sonchifolius]
MAKEPELIPHLQTGRLEGGRSRDDFGNTFFAFSSTMAKEPQLTPHLQTGRLEGGRSRITTMAKEPQLIRGYLCDHTPIFFNLFHKHFVFPFGDRLRIIISSFIFNDVHIVVIHGVENGFIVA